MPTREELCASLRPLVARMHQGHCWIKGPHGPRCLQEQKFTEVELSEHVTRGRTYGLCPIAPGTKSCRVAALDFDSHKGETPWPEMLAVAERVAVALEVEGYRPHLFKSSGGKGIHLYLVWDEAQDAHSVREMLNAMLAGCGYAAGTKGVSNHEVEIFPKQSEVPHDGFGSMFILPFSGAAMPLGDWQGWHPSPAVPMLEPTEREVRELPEGADLSRLEAALDAIPNEGTQELSYDDWRNIIFGIHHATDGSDQGLLLAHRFSARSSKYDSVFLDERVWPYIRSERGGAVVTDRSIYSRASAAGWTDPLVADDFEVVVSGKDTCFPDTTAVEKIRFVFQPAPVFSAGKPPGWIIRDVIPRADLVVIYGESQSGKSFLALDMAGAIVQGTPWRGKATERMRVGYIAAEGAGGTRNRLRALAQHHGWSLENLMVLGAAPNFMDKQDVVELVEAMRAAGPLGLVFVDTLAQVSPGGNENAGEDMGKIIGHCHTIHAVTGATVVLIHHSGKDASKGARGWSGLRAAADAEIEITRCEHDRVATVTKLKDGADGASFGFKLQVVPLDMDDNGEVVSSCVIEHCDAGPQGTRRKLPMGEMEKRVWEACRGLQAVDGSHPSVSEVIDEAVNHTPWDANSMKRDTRRQHALRAVDSLAGKGKIAVDSGRITVREGQV